MLSNKTLSVFILNLVVLGFYSPVCHAMQLTFEITGFTGGGIFSGSFTGQDINNDGQLIENFSVLFDDSVPTGEITNFNAQFSGDSNVPDFAFTLDDVETFQSSWDLDEEGNGENGFFDIQISTVEANIDILSGNFGPDFGNGIFISNLSTSSSSFAPGSLFASVPEPSPYWGSILLLGLGVYFKKQFCCSGPTRASGRID